MTAVATGRRPSPRYRASSICCVLRAISCVVRASDRPDPSLAKSGTAYTPFWDCNGCGGDPSLTLGNIGSGSADPALEGGFGGSYRSTVVGDPYKKTGDALWDRSAFGLPIIGSQVFDNPTNAKRGFLMGPGAWGVNLGVTKSFRLTERARLSFRAVFDNAFNHPLRSLPGASSTVG